MLWKCEYVGAFAGVRKDLMSASSLFLTEVTELYGEAVRMKQAPADLDPALAARETLCFYAGLLKLWLADENGVTVRGEVRQLIARHVAGRRLQKAV
jgi:TetR/AcrR family acrAB operon transcriptional repressor